MIGDRFVVVDIESTGLDVHTCAPLEYGCGIYDRELNEIDTFQCFVWDSPIFEKNVIPRMHPAAREMHEKSGLLHTAEIAGMSLSDADEAFADWLEGHGVKGGPRGDTSEPMVGSSVHFDREFLGVYAPRTEGLFHYRNIDVSTVKELCKRLNPRVHNTLPEPRKEHRVIPDIEDTVRELKHYMDNFLFVVD